MKRFTSLILCLFVFSLLSGCSENSDDPKTRIIAQTTGVRDVIESQMALENGSEETTIETSAPTPTPDPLTDETAESLGANGVDYDLTILGSDMVYAEIYNMMIFPKTYIGRTVRVKGVFTVYYDEANDKYHFACFVSDAAACCQQGIEFILDGNKSYPANYPAEGAEICVEGVFGTYEEDGAEYWALTNAKLI